MDVYVEVAIIKDKEKIETNVDEKEISETDENQEVDNIKNLYAPIVINDQVETTYYLLDLVYLAGSKDINKLEKVEKEAVLIENFKDVGSIQTKVNDHIIKIVQDVVGIVFDIEKINPKIGENLLVDEKDDIV